MLAYRLADRLGIANVDQMLAGLSSTQLTEWAAYFTILDAEHQEQQLAAETEANLQAMKGRQR